MHQYKGDTAAYHLDVCVNMYKITNSYIYVWRSQTLSSIWRNSVLYIEVTNSIIYIARTHRRLSQTLSSIWRNSLLYKNSILYMDVTDSIIYIARTHWGLRHAKPTRVYTHEITYMTSRTLSFIYEDCDLCNLTLTNAQATLPSICGHIYDITNSIIRWWRLRSLLSKTHERTGDFAEHPELEDELKQQVDEFIGKLRGKAIANLRAALDAAIAAAAK